MAVTKLAVAGWLTAAAAVTTVGVAGIYQLVATSTPAAAASNNGNGNGHVNGNNGNGAGGTNQPPGKAVTVSGSVVGKIGLGSPATLNVTVDNPNNQALVITKVMGTITSVTSAGQAGKPACSAAWYSVGTFTGSKALPKNGSAIVAVPLTLTPLSSTNQDNCKGSTVTFAFSATAEQA